ncbi:hypothetical protein CAOG_006036 [Capsaspora owczarzaki ATCC 30864]|uniref:Uncharacterized protein n=2 Tax=Capsaspora owczarzaki (strain ATCC 30864) TaxID=595528 RepID=A0A0D2WTA2_CAPO3|nr:hypothetical protein CAOG_006036 [Capsaspora owczarzaki ATCC 30864]
MGQYYICVVINDERRVVWAYSTFGGAKLMEHSYFGQRRVLAAMERLRHRPQRMVWVGDYADGEPDGTHLYSAGHEWESENHGDVNTKHWRESDSQDKSLKSEESLRFLVNHDRHEIIDLQVYLRDDVHPLPLLTAEGNGRGGGDFLGNGNVGIWSRQLISSETLLDAQVYIDLGYTKVEQFFTEG